MAYASNNVRHQSIRREGSRSWRATTNTLPRRRRTCRIWRLSQMSARCSLLSNKEGGAAQSFVRWAAHGLRSQLVLHTVSPTLLGQSLRFKGFVPKGRSARLQSCPVTRTNTSTPRHPPRRRTTIRNGTDNEKSGENARRNKRWCTTMRKSEQRHSKSRKSFGSSEVDLECEETLFRYDHVAAAKQGK